MAVPSYLTSVALGSSGNVGPTTGIDTTGATALRVVVITQQAGTPTVTDSRTNTWVADRAAVLLSSTYSGYVHFLKATTNNVGTAHTFSATGTSACSIWPIAVGPSAGGTLTLTAFDAIADPNSPYTSNSITPANADALLICFGATDGAGSNVTTTWQNGETKRADVTDHDNFWGGSIATRVVTSSGSYSTSFTDNSSGPTNSVVAILAVTESAAGGTAQDLAGTAAGQATASGAATVGKPLAGGAQAQATASASLSVGGALSGAAAGQASATGALSVLTPAPLRWAFSRQNRPGRGPYSLGKYFRPSLAAFREGFISLFGNAAGAATAAAALGIAKTLGGNAAGQASANAALALAKSLAGTASGNVLAGGQLAVSVLLNGAAGGVSTATGSLGASGVVDLVGAATAQATAAAGLQLSISLSGAALGVASASGAVSHSVPLNAAAVALASASGQLSISVALSGAALAQATADASFAGVVTLSGSAAAQAGAAGSLFLQVPLGAAAQAIAAAGGVLVVTFGMSANAQGQATATGSLTKQVVLSGAAAGQAAVMGVVTVAGVGVLTDRAYRARVAPRRWVARASKRRA